MNFTELRNFIKVADLGSFEKASRDLFLNPSSVIRQINSLEKETGLVLFNRTPQGVKLTSSGKCFYYDVTALLSKMDEAVLKARTASDDQSNVVSIGVSLSEPFRDSRLAQKVLPLLRYHAFRMVQYRSDEMDRGQIISDLGKQIDLFPACCGFGSLQKRFPFFALYRSACMIALTHSHTLSRKKALTFADLAGQTIYVPDPAIDTSLQAAAGRFSGEVQDVRLIETDTFSISACNMAAISGSLILCTEDWHIAHPSLCLKPLAEDISVPFGFFYDREPSDAVAKLLLLLRSRGYSGNIEDLV